MADDWQLVRDALSEAGVNGVDDLGRFVNDTTYLDPSELDETTAGPVLLALLPQLNDPRVVAAVGRHLQGGGLRGRPGAFEVVRVAFIRWAAGPGDVGWVLGDTLARVADRTAGPDLIHLACQRDLGPARQCIVESLWRFKAEHDIQPVLRRLMRDPDVASMALSSLQRTIGAEAMIEVLEGLLDEQLDPGVTAAARRQLSRARRKLARG